MMAAPLRVATAPIWSGSMSYTIHPRTGVRFSTRVGRKRVPCSSVQPSLRRGFSLRGDKKKQTSRHNLGVRWVADKPPHAAIAFFRRRTYDGAALSINGATFCQGRWLRQLPLGGGARVRMDCALCARVESGEPAQPCYRGVLGLVERVCGPGQWRERPRRPVATRHAHVSGTGKKDDIR